MYEHPADWRPNSPNARAVRGHTFCIVGSVSKNLGFGMGVGCMAIRAAEPGRSGARRGSPLGLLQFAQLSAQVLNLTRHCADSIDQFTGRHYFPINSHSRLV